MIATYDLRQCQATFEFFLWLVLVQAMGATKISIDQNNPKTSKIPLPMIRQRTESILIPGCALAGLPVKKYAVPGQVHAHARDFFDWVRAGKSFRRLTSVKVPVSVLYTV